MTMTLTRYAFCLYFGVVARDSLGYLGLALSVVKAFTQLEPVWFLFNLAGIPTRVLCSFFSVYTQVCSLFLFL